MDPLGLDWPESPGGRHNTNTSPDLQIKILIVKCFLIYTPQQQGIKITSNYSQSTIILPLHLEE